MNREWLLGIVADLRQGMQVEDLKIDVKREWWRLGTPDGDAEFARDLCAIVNTRGGGDGAIIVGVDSLGALYPAPISTTKMDKSALQQLIIRRCEPSFEIRPWEYEMEGKIITVVELPRSSNRPHVVKDFKNWKNYIPVRKSTGTFAANRYDLDEMYADRIGDPAPAPEVAIEGPSIHMFLEREGASWPKGFYLVPPLRVRNPGQVGSTLEHVNLTLRPEGAGDQSARLHGLALSGVPYRHMPMPLLAGDSLLGTGYFVLDDATANAIGNIQHAYCEWEIRATDVRQRTRVTQGKGLQLVRR